MMGDFAEFELAVTVNASGRALPCEGQGGLRRPGARPDGRTGAGNY
jgi:hypothetical protein